ncbi:MAG: hypothetical protein LC793_12255 [Thermomicrobia bacterium]|nr:hypothetical protein [Thermomicrobia bacterium]MCA1722658.1 hypothetical protein [Thermomicrobia bacterium]
MSATTLTAAEKYRTKKECQELADLLAYGIAGESNALARMMSAALAMRKFAAISAVMDYWYSLSEPTRTRCVRHSQFRRERQREREALRRMEGLGDGVTRLRGVFNEARAKESRSPQEIARRIESVEQLTRLIANITNDLPTKPPKRLPHALALIEAYREELALRTAFPNRPQPAYDWASVLLTAREEALLLEVKRRLQPDSTEASGEGER